MGILFGGTERRTAPTWAALDASMARTSVSDAPSALRLAPLYAATRLLADQIAAAPLRAYQPRADGVRQMLPTQPAILRSPGIFAWKFRAMTSMLLWGNAYGLIASRDANGWPTAVVWLPPAQVTCDGDGSTDPKFTWAGRSVPSADVVHVPAYTVPGQAAGISPIAAFRQLIETGQAAQAYAREWYDGGGIPAAVLQNEAKAIEPEEAAQVKARAKASLSNGDIFVTGRDWTYKPIGAPAADMRFIETSKLTATHIGAVYGVPPEKIGGETGSSLTYSTLEENQQNLAMETVRPWAVRFEDAISALFAGRTYVRFNLDSGIRAALKNRYEAHEIATRIGLETNDEMRALEERPPLTDEQLAQWQSMYGKRPIADPVTRDRRDHASE